MQTTDQTQVSPALRLSAAFAAAKAAHQGLLIPYFMCGYPSLAQSVVVTVAAAQAGADIIELGMPFSDPLADGPTIQHADQVALERGMTMRGCMEVARQVAAQSSVPLVFMGYYNPILAYGIERFCTDAVASGVCGVIVPDLPPEEAAPLREAAVRYGLAMIFLVPPTTPDERIVQIAAQAATIPGSFLYCVSLSGVTGARGQLPEHLPAFLARVQYFTRQSNLPLVVGFGLSQPEHISTVTSLVEGAVVGSALVKLLGEHPDHEQAAAVSTYIHQLSSAAKH